LDEFNPLPDTVCRVEEIVMQRTNEMKLATVTPEHVDVAEFQELMALGELKAAEQLLKKTEKAALDEKRRFEKAGMLLAESVFVYRLMIGHVKGRKGGWTSFLKRLGMSESQARGLIHAYQRIYGNPDTANLVRESATPQTSVVLIAAPSNPDKAVVEFLEQAEQGPVSVAATKEIIARHKSDGTTGRPIPESVAITGVGRVVLHPAQDADQMSLAALKQALQRIADQLQAERTGGSA